MLKPTDPTLRKYKIAALNARLHQTQLCPANHNVNYHNGWYYVDGNPSQRPSLTRRAKELMDEPGTEVRFNDAWNTYVLQSVTDDGHPQQGSVAV